MNVSLDPEYEKFIHEQVKAGRFASSAEALQAGIACLMVDCESDVLDERDIIDIQQSLAQIRRGEVVDSATVHAEIRQPLINS
jgi:Arc/MetJ-type ribon-helix-helix transcriptional regulator